MNGSGLWEQVDGINFRIRLLVSVFELGNVVTGPESSFHKRATGRVGAGYGFGHGKRQFFCRRLQKARRSEASGSGEGCRWLLSAIPESLIR